MPEKNMYSIQKQVTRILKECFNDNILKRKMTIKAITITDILKRGETCNSLQESYVPFTEYPWIFSSDVFNNVIQVNLVMPRIKYC